MNLVSKIKENPLLIFQVVLVVLLIVLAIVFVVVLYSKNPEWIFNLLGINESGEPNKYEVLKFLGISMGGILVALQALASHRRAKAMEDTAKHTEQGQRQERLKNAIEHLGHETDSVRLGGIYELFHLAEDNKDLRKTALDILCAHIRRTTSETKYRAQHESKPSEEIQSLLRLLFVQNHEIFKGLQINLQESWLNGANLRKARLQGAILTETHMQGTTLTEAHLQGADLTEAHLQAANLNKACLQGATLREADLQEADLCKTYLQGADLSEARMQRAALNKARMQGSCLLGTGLQGAYLFFVHLQGANILMTCLQGAALDKARLQGAGCKNWSVETPFADRIKDSIGQENDLSETIFEGALSQEDVDFLSEGLSDRGAKGLRWRLKPHIDEQESNELPEDSGAITGTYSKKNAKKWIAEYEKAMSEVPKDDS